MFEFINPAFVDSLNEPDAPSASTISLADAIYSLKLWNPDYGGNCIRIRRSSDNGETDIGFDSGFVDETAITDHCGNDDGFIVTWYDQSGNGYNATQSTAGSQAQIADGDPYGASVINGSDGSPAATFASDYYNATPTDGYIAKNGTVVCHGQADTSTSAHYYYTEFIPAGVVFGAGVNDSSQPRAFMCHWNNASWQCPGGSASVSADVMRSMIQIVDAGGNDAGSSSATVYGYENNVQKFTQGSINSTLSSNSQSKGQFGASTGGGYGFSGEIRTLILFREVLTSAQRAEFNTMV